jgi:DNA-binding transcriptional LysR family regulator
MGIACAIRHRPSINANVTETGYRATSLATLVHMVGASSGVTLLPALLLTVENRRIIWRSGRLSVLCPVVRSHWSGDAARLWKRRFWGSDERCGRC